MIIIRLSLIAETFHWHCTNDCNTILQLIGIRSFVCPVLHAFTCMAYSSERILLASAIDWHWKLCASKNKWKFIDRVFAHYSTIMKYILPTIVKISCFRNANFRIWFNCAVFVNFFFWMEYGKCVNLSVWLITFFTDSTEWRQICKDTIQNFWPLAVLSVAWKVDRK